MSDVNSVLWVRLPVSPPNFAKTLYSNQLTKLK
ncbi:hypothetical protein VPHD480_0375 [Vibrio phage D480]